MPGNNDLGPTQNETPDPKRAVRAAYLDWRAAGYPDYGTPGTGGRYDDGHYVFACPGCGRFGAIRVGHPKPLESPSWNIVSGTLDNPTALTLQPSINCINCCKWHGYLREGVFSPC